MAITVSYTVGTNTLEVTGGDSGTPATVADLYTYADNNNLDIDGDPIVESPIAGVYIFRCNVSIGDGVISTFFKSLDEMICFNDGCTFNVKSEAALQSGELVGSRGVNGSSWSVAPSASMSILASGATGSFLFYGSSYISRNGNGVILNTGDVDMRNCSAGFSDSPGTWKFGTTLNSLILRDVYFWGTTSIRLGTTPDEMSNVHIHSTSSGFLGDAAITLEDTLVTSFSANDYRPLVTGEMVVLNPQSPPTNPLISNASASIPLKYSVNIHTSDKDGAALSDVDIAATYAHVVRADDGNDYKCIVPFTAINDEFKPYNGTGDWVSKWELFTTTDDDFVGGDWQTGGFQYKADEPESASWQDTSTNDNGDLIGGELIRNGDFELGGLFEWTADAGWVVNGSNQAVGTATWGDIKDLSQNFGGVIGNDYEFKYDVIACDLDQSFRMSSDSIFGDINLPKTVGTHTLILTAVNNSATFDLYVFVSSLNTTGRSITIDNVSVRQVGQIVQYKKWFGTNPDLETRVYKFTYARADYPDFVMSNKIMDKPTAWEVQLKKASRSNARTANYGRMAIIKC